MTTDAAAPACTVYYDGACPVCAREIAHYKTRAGAERIAFVDASAEGAETGEGLSREAALARMHARLPDGTLVSGAAAFAAVWTALPGWRWLGRLVSLPGARHAAELGYRAFLRLRPLWRRPRAP